MCIVTFSIIKIYHDYKNHVERKPGQILIKLTIEVPGFWLLSGNRKTSGGYQDQNPGQLWFSNLSTLCVLDEGYSRNASCVLNLISTFLLLSQGRYICWWTIRVYRLSSGQYFGTDMMY